MRKVLIASAVALVLFAVGAFAASFLVNSEDIASGTDDVAACADLVDVDFTTVYDATLNDWTVDSAVVTFYDEGTGGNVETTDCAGFGANLVVETTDPDSGTAGPQHEGAATVATGATSVNVPLGDGLLASWVTSAAVLVDGMTLEVPSPGQGVTATTSL